MDESMISSLISLDSRLRERGRLHSSLGYVSLVDTANTLLLTAPTGHTLWLIALSVYNRNSAAVNLQVGTGATLTQRDPRYGPFITNYQTMLWLPPHEYESDIYVTSSAGAASPSEVQVKAFAIAVG